MAAEMVEVPFGDSPSETATLLLAAAEELDRDPSEVRTTSDGFLVPEDIVAQVSAERPENSPSPRSKKSRAAQEE